MNITDLVERCLKDSIEKYGKDDSIVKMCKDCMTFFGYKVLEEINRLNFTAFTIIDDNDFNKQGFANMLLNYLVDEEDEEEELVEDGNEEDEKYGKIHFDEYKAWKDNSIEKPRTSTANYYIVVELSNGKYDFAKWSVENETWTNQNGEILADVVRWREFNRQVI